MTVTDSCTVATERVAFTVELWAISTLVVRSAVAEAGEREAHLVASGREALEDVVPVLRRHRRALALQRRRADGHGDSREGAVRRRTRPGPSGCRSGSPGPRLPRRRRRMASARPRLRRRKSISLSLEARRREPRSWDRTKAHAARPRESKSGANGHNTFWIQRVNAPSGNSIRSAGSKCTNLLPPKLQQIESQVERRRRADVGHAGTAARASWSFQSSASAVKGFWRKRVPGSSRPWWPIASSV